MPAPFDYNVQRPDIMGAIGAYEAGRDRNRQVMQQGKQDMFAQYLPGALKGNQADIDQASQYATPDQQIQLSKIGPERLKQALDQSQAIAEIIGSVPDGDAQGFEAAKQRAVAMGIPADALGKLTVADLPRLKAQSGQTLKELQIEAARVGIDVSRANIRQSDAAAAASRASAARAAQGAGKAPNGYAWNADGTGLIPLPGGPADPARKLTEGQSKDLAYYNRGTAANAKLDDSRIKEMMGMGNTAGRSVPIIGNAMQSDSSRQGVQASKDFIAALLRKDTGAAVTPQEFDFYADIFIPAYGDDPVTLRQKAEARQKALEAIKSGMGGASSLADASPPPLEGEAAATAGPQEGATGVSKSGKPIVFTGGKWIYR